MIDEERHPLVNPNERMNISEKSAVKEAEVNRMFLPMRPDEGNSDDLQGMNEEIPEEEPNKKLTITVSHSCKINIRCDICYEEGEDLTFQELQNCKHVFHTKCLHNLIQFQVSPI